MATSGNLHSANRPKTGIVFRHEGTIAGLGLDRQFLLVVRFHYQKPEVLMTLPRIKSCICKVINEVQTLSGRPCIEMNWSTKPVGGLDGFDSLMGLEATVLVEERLGCRLEHDSIFISDDGTRALSIQQICERIAESIETKGDKA